MEVDITLLTPVALAMACVLAALVLLAALLLAPWRAWMAVSARQHVFFSAMFALALLWSIALHPAAGLTMHYLGMTTATVLLGWALATLAGALALGILCLAGQTAFDVLPLTWLLTAVAPATAIAGLLWLLERSRLRNPFVFLLGVGFGGAMLSMLALVAAGLAALACAGQHGLVSTAIEHAALLPLLLFSEGFINGAAVSTITVYFPHLVRGFNEARFFGEE